MQPRSVLALSKSESHTFNKFNCDTITLLEGFGVEGDAHMGATVKHRSRVAQDPTQPNQRQVHLIHAELFEELAAKGFSLSAGLMGENITTLGVDLLGLPKGTILKIGKEVAIQITGLRNPCSQLESIQSGLMKAVLDKDAAGNLVRKAGIMGVVLAGGVVSLGDAIVVELPEGPFVALDRV